MIEYKNKELVENVDKIAQDILNARKSNQHRDKFFPQLIDKMDLKIGVEIGVDVAQFSSRILERSKIERYYCVDTWQDDFGSDCPSVSFDKDGNKRYTAATDTLKDFIVKERAMPLRMTGVEASKHFANETIDFCYIDGDHSLEGIYTDIKAWLPKLKVGGILSGHDYKDGPKSGISDYFGQQLPYHIKTVVDNYCMRYGHKLNVVGNRILSWWFIKNCPTQDHVKVYMLESPLEDK